MIRRHDRGEAGRRRPAGVRRRNAIAAAIAVVLLALAVYGAFVKHLPFGSQFTVRAVFSSANGLKIGSPVRIGGLPVGTVAGIGPGPDNTSTVTLALDNRAGVHDNTTLAIEPRLLFEGNFYVRLDPGSPDAPLLRSGETIPLAHTTVPVQIDQLLDVLDAPTRESLKQTFGGLAAGLGAPARASTAEPAGYAALRSAARQLSAALIPSAQTADALEGTSPGDLGRAISSSSETATQLAENPAALSDLVSASDQVLAALASGQGALAHDISALDHLTKVAPATLSALDGAFPALSSFALKLSPSLIAAPATLKEVNGLFEQLRALAAPGELPRLVDGLGALTSTAPAFERRLRAMFPLLSDVTACTSRNVVPTLDMVLQDGANTTGYPAWKDLLHLTAALSGASASFDGNGVALRIGVAEGDQSASGLIPGFGQLTGSYQAEGVRPAWLGYGVVPPFRPDQSCDRQPLPEVNK
jgi:virulence factor Mce-like protein